jgi:hypothetical protein
MLVRSTGPRARKIALASPEAQSSTIRTLLGLLAIGRKLGRKRKNVLARFWPAKRKRKSQNRSAGSTILGTLQ